MYFLYHKQTGEISPPIRKGEPSERAINKERDCEIGSGIKWENVDLFYAPDSEFPEDFAKTAPLGKYYINLETGEVEENPGWQLPEEEIEEWL